MRRLKYWLYKKIDKAVWIYLKKRRGDYPIYSLFRAMGAYDTPCYIKEGTATIDQITRQDTEDILYCDVIIKFEWFDAEANRRWFEMSDADKLIAKSLGGVPMPDFGKYIDRLK